MVLPVFEYPQQVYEECCPICLRPVLGENCVSCCDQCQESRWLHRRCLLGLLCRSECSEGHPLTELQTATCQTCSCCSKNSLMHWHCKQCAWYLCRTCIEGSLETNVRCPTCGAAFPTTIQRTQTGPVWIFDEHGVNHTSVISNKSTDFLDRLFPCPSKFCASTL